MAQIINNKKFPHMLLPVFIPRVPPRVLQDRVCELLIRLYHIFKKKKGQRNYPITFIFEFEAIASLDAVAGDNFGSLGGYFG
jgi:hypothetical protein